MVEYFILFALVALMTVLGFTRFDDDLKASLEGLVNAATVKMAN